MNAEVRYHLSVIARRAPLFLVVSLTISSIGLLLAVVLPTVYTAEGKLLVEDPQIPTNLAASTVQMNELEQLAVIQQRVMTRTTLLDIAREHDVYTDLAEMNADQIVRRMRADTVFLSSGRREAATVMDVRFRARTPKIAADVANEYITRILAVNAQQRQSRATGTLEFFEQEVDRLQTELNLRNEEMLRFQNQNREALPSTLDYRLNRQSDLQEQLAQLARDRSSLEDQRARLFELQQAGALRAPGTSSAASPEERRLASLREELSSARAVYAEESPRVQMLKSRIASLEAQVAAQPAVGGATAAGSGVAKGPIALQIDEIDAELARLDERNARMRDELDALEATIERTPANAITLEALERDYDNIVRQYNQALERLAQASTGERIETLSKGQRITVIEQATAPSEPSDPNRPLIAGAGAGLGLGLATALVVVVEFLNRAIRRPVDLTHRLGITPIATVPYIATPGERLRRRMLGLFGIAIVLAGVPAALWLVHYEVMPLDLAFDRIVTALVP